MLSGIQSHTRRGVDTDGALSERKQRMYSFLRENPIGVLSTVTPNGEPHGVVVYFSVDRQFRISILTRTETKKYENLTRNNHAMLTVFEPHTQAVAQLTGRATEIYDSSMIASVAGSIAAISQRTSDAGLPPVSKLNAGAFAVIQIMPLQLRMAVYDRPDFGDYQNLFESVESFDID